MNRYKQNLRIEGNKVISYVTHVATIEGDTLKQLGYWSMTTQKHINYVAKELNLKLIKSIDMNTKENNKLIAEFMELPKVSCNIGTEDGHFTEGYKHPKIDVPIIPSGMQYKYSWDLLMPVVEKILDISFQDEGDAEDFYYIRDCMPDINHTYKAVVEFIKKYNKKNRDEHTR